MKVCPHCNVPETKLKWGPEGTRFEDCWTCRCGGHGCDTDLIEENQTNEET